MNLFLLGLDLREELLLGLGDLRLALLQGVLLGIPPLLGDLLLGSGGAGGVGTDGGVRLLVHALDGVGSDAELDKAGELPLEGFLVLLLKCANVR